VHLVWREQWPGLVLGCRCEEFQFISYVESVYPQIYTDIKVQQDISDENMTLLKGVAQEFSSIFVSEETFTL